MTAHEQLADRAHSTAPSTERSNGHASFEPKQRTVGSSVFAIEPEGEIDLANAAELEAALLAAEREGASEIIVDLGQVTFVDSTCLKILASGHRRLTERDAVLTLLCSDRHILRVLALTKLDTLLTIKPARARATLVGADTTTNLSAPAR